MKLIYLFIFLSFIGFSQTNNVIKKDYKWSLGTTFGYTNVITPFNRSNYQLALNMKYKVNYVTVNFQPGINYTYDTKITDLRFTFRLQYDFLKW